MDAAQHNVVGTGIVVVYCGGRGGGGLLRTCKLGFYALAHEPELYIIQGPENIGRHNGFLVLECRNLVGPVADEIVVVSALQKISWLGERWNVRIR